MVGGDGLEIGVGGGGGQGFNKQTRICLIWYNMEYDLVSTIYLITLNCRGT